MTERKRDRTRRRLLEEAYRLFDAKGYEQTTVAEIAAAAEVVPATFFNHFRTKEELIFSDGQRLLADGLAAIAGRRPDESAATVLGRAMTAMMDSTRSGIRDPAGKWEAIRVRLLLTVPSLQGSTLRLLFDVQRQLAEALGEAFPDELDKIEAAALVGAMTGGVVNAVFVALRDDLPLEAAFQRAIDTVSSSSVVGDTRIGAGAVRKVRGRR